MPKGVLFLWVFFCYHQIYKTKYYWFYVNNKVIAIAYIKHLYYICIYKTNNK